MPKEQFSEAFYKKILDERIGPFSISSRDGIIYSNQAMAELVGVSDPNELIAADSTLWVHPDDRELVRLYAEKRRRGEDVPERYSFRITTKDGTVKTVETKSEVIHFEDEPINLSFVRDISDRVESKESIDNMMDLAPIAIMTFSFLAHVTSCNRATEVLTGYSKDEIIGKHVSQLGYLNVDTIRDLLSQLTLVVQGKGKHQYTFPYTTKKGEKRRASAVYRIINRSSGKREILVIVEDITDRHRWEKRLNSLYNHTVDLLKEKTEEGVYKKTFETLQDALEGVVFNLQVVEDGYLVDKHWILEPMRLPIDSKGVTPRAVRTAKTQLVPDTRLDPDYIDTNTDLELLSELAVPILSDNEVVAVINVESTILDAFTEADKEVMETLAANVGNTISRIRNLSLLEESEDRLSGFMKSATENFTIVDKNLRYVEANETALQRMGFSKDQVIGRTITELFPDAFEKGRVKVYERVLETGIPASIIDVKGIRNGEERIFNIHVFPVGDGLGIIAADTTDTVLSRQALSESEERYRSFSEAASESFIQFDSDFNILNINTVGIQRLGIPREEVLGMHMLDIMPNLRGSQRYADYKKILLTGESQIFDVVNHSTGIRHLRINAFKVGDGLGILATDLSELVEEQEKRDRLFEELAEERVQREKEEEMSRLKTQFMNTATHEIKTPLTAILGYIELIDEAFKESNIAAVTSYYEVLKRNANRLGVLTDDLLDLQRLESDRIDLSLETINVRAFVGRIINEIRPFYSEKKISIEMMIEPELEIKADPVRLRQIIINLVINAIKFSFEKTIVQIIAKVDGESVEISVIDHGIGMSPEDLTKLFVPFPDIVPTSGGKGTGLGLSICKRLVELHGGEIWAESDGSGKGSTFTFSLPIS